MDLTRLLVQLVIAVVCGGIATLLLPRQIPGKLLGLALMGLAGVWLGEWMIHLIKSTYRLPLPSFVTWAFYGVPILPAIVGSAVVLFVVTTFISWGRYQR